MDIFFTIIGLLLWTQGTCSAIPEETLLRYLEEHCPSAVSSRQPLSEINGKGVEIAMSFTARDFDEINDNQQT